ALHGALHVGDLFGALVDEDDHEVYLGVVLRDGVRDLLQHDGLAGLGRRDDQAALALSDRGDQVDDALGELLGNGLEAQALLRVQRGELAELQARAGVLRRQPVDRVDLDQRVVLLASLLLALVRLLDRADDRVALAQVVLLHLAERDVHVTGPREVAGGAHERIVVKDVEDAGDRDQHIVLADLRLELVGVLIAAATTLVALAGASRTGLLVAVTVILRTALAVVLAVAAPAAATAAAVPVAAATPTGALTVAGRRVVVGRAVLLTVRRLLRAALGTTLGGCGVLRRSALFGRLGDAALGVGALRVAA